MESSITPSTGRKTGIQTTILVVAVLLTVAAGDWVAGTYSRDSNPTAQFHRRSNVISVSRYPEHLPRPDGRRKLLLIGNSHTYALPGVEKGDPLRPDAAPTVLDRLADSVAPWASHDAGIDFYLLSYPNFLPLEMLTRIHHALDRGFRPDLVILGLTWRNIARDTALRHEIRQTLMDPEFVDSLRRALAAPSVSATWRVTEAIDAERRQIAHQQEQERMQSHADRIDSTLTSSAGRYIHLIGESTTIRARLYRQLAYAIEDLFVQPQGMNYSHKIIQRDLDLNLDCLEALLRLLAADGVPVLVYLAPERSDLPAIVDPAGSVEVLARVRKVTRELAQPLLDARNVVPDSYWGWERHTPDRSHFTEPGHQLLANFLFEAGEDLNIWRPLFQQPYPGDAQ